MEENKIQIGKYVELAYEIFVVDNEGEASVCKITAERPDAFVFGHDTAMVRGFVNGIRDLKQGDKFDFTLEPDDAFGARDEELVVELPRDTFMVEGEFDGKRVFIGAHVPMMTADGYRIDGTVEAIDDDNVTMDFNHELAGETVHYVGQVLLVRDATADELSPKHHHCGCGCDHDHDHCDHDHCGHDGCDCDGCDCDGCK